MGCCNGFILLRFQRNAKAHVVIPAVVLSGNPDLLSQPNVKNRQYRFSATGVSPWESTAPGGPVSVVVFMWFSQPG